MCVCECVRVCVYKRHGRAAGVRHMITRLVYAHTALAMCWSPTVRQFAARTPIITTLEVPAIAPRRRHSSGFLLLIDECLHKRQARLHHNLFDARHVLHA